MSEPMLASIIINNYNYADFLEQAIDSAIYQTYPHTEVIVVDDGSTDGSRDVISGYGDSVRPVFKENGGQASTFNAGFAAAKGEVIFLLDADDVFMPQKVETVMDVFKRHPQSGWCFHTLKLISDAHKTLFEPFPKGDALEQIYDMTGYIRSKGTVSFDPPATSGLCFRRSLLAQVLPMPEGKHISIGDHYLKFTTVALTPGVFLEQNLANQTIHGNNAYTWQPKNQLMQARILILAAYWIRQKFPNLERFTHGLLARGMSASWRAGGIEADQRDFVASYLRSLSWLDRFKLNSRAVYRYLVPR